MQMAVVGLIVAIAGFHLLSVTTAAIPTNKTSTSLKPMTSYLNPFFTQNWRLFAPNPISSDRSIEFRGQYDSADGSSTTTKWLNWTDVELDLVHHKVVGGRAGYITNKLVGPLNSRFLAMTEQQRETALNDRKTALDGYATLRKKLTGQSDNAGTVNLYLRYETTIIGLATAALKAAHPGVDFTAIRYRIVDRDVAPYSERRMKDYVRPAPTIRRSGWRAPIQASKAEQDTITSFYRRHR